ncbi:MAG: endonuclease/exonuclease/phosphatase family protein [Bacteroidaceae bacterium]|nr:endonuclease/exonuclease/phosphatase family protein [Bacteroidaceae bacterium]
MKIGKIIKRSVGLVNVLFICLMLLVAYSERVSPMEHPTLSLVGLTFPIFALINAGFLLFWLIIAQWKYALLPFIGFLLCGSQIRATFPLNLWRSNPPEAHLKLLSYNVMSFDGDKKENGQNPILNYLKESEADIMCLQEFIVSGKSQYLTQRDVDKALKAYPYKHVSKENPHMACYSKYPILSVTPLHAKNSRNGAFAYEIAAGEDTLLVINCHLESNHLTKEDKATYEDIIEAPETAKVKEGIRLFTRKLGENAAKRAPQAERVAKAIAESKHPHVIAMGDFNDSPVSYPHYVISRQLKDAFAQSGFGAGISYHLNRFYFRLDNIMVSPTLQSYKCQVDNTISDSDHYPIRCFVAKKQ